MRRVFVSVATDPAHALRGATGCRGGLKGRRARREYLPVQGGHGQYHLAGQATGRFGARWRLYEVDSDRINDHLLMPESTVALPDMWQLYITAQ